MADNGIFKTIEAGTTEELERLLAEDPGSARANNEAGVSALLYSLYNRRPEMTARILALATPRSALEEAALGRVVPLKKRMAGDAECINRVGADGFSALHLACFFSNAGTVAFLLTAGAKVEAVSGAPMRLRPLHSAAAVGNLESCRLLLEHGADPNAQQQGGWGPIHAAAMHGNLALLDLLLKHGANPEQAAEDGQTALELARGKGHAELVSRIQRLA